MFRIIIEEIVTEPRGQDTHTDPQSIERYRQTVDVLDLAAVMAAVNRKPRRPRTPKQPKEQP